MRNKILLHGGAGTLVYDIASQVAVDEGGRTMTVADIKGQMLGTGIGYAVSDVGTMLDTIDYVPVYSKHIEGRSRPALLADTQTVIAARADMEKTLMASFLWNADDWRPSVDLTSVPDAHAGPMSFCAGDSGLKIVCLSGVDWFVWVRKVRASRLDRMYLNVNGYAAGQPIKCIGRGGAHFTVINGSTLQHVHDAVTAHRQ